jgi:type IV pilus assembly protein PilC
LKKFWRLPERHAMPNRNHASTAVLFLWEGTDRQGRLLRGEVHAYGSASVSAGLRRQGIHTISVRKKPRTRPQALRARDITLFTRQLATMLRAGIPLLQAFDIVARSQAKPAMAQLVRQLRSDVSSGSSLQQALMRHPQHFDLLFCNLVAAGEQAGLLDDILANLAQHQEKTLAIKSQVRAALTYPLAIVLCAVLVMAVIMIWVVPSFTQVFSSFGASLPWPTLAVIAISDFMQAYWWVLTALCAAMASLLTRVWRHSPHWRARADRWLLQLPLFGAILRKATLARWTRTLATLFAAGLPLVDALQSVARAAGNAVYADATEQIARQVSQGSSLATAIEATRQFPDMVGQMVAIGEESGALDQMLSKVADFYEIEVNEAVASLAILLEPIIMLVLGVSIGGLIIAMYLPIFKLGSVI